MFCSNLKIRKIRRFAENGRFESRFEIRFFSSVDSNRDSRFDFFRTCSDSRSKIRGWYFFQHDSQLRFAESGESANLKIRKS